MKRSHKMVSDLFTESRSKNLNAKLASLVTDVCNSCLGSGSIQFCGGETCPDCGGSGKPPNEVPVYKCTKCNESSLREDLELFSLCSGEDSKHDFKLFSTRVKSIKNALY